MARMSKFQSMGGGVHLAGTRNGIYEVKGRRGSWTASFMAYQGRKVTWTSKETFSTVTTARAACINHFSS